MEKPTEFNHILFREEKHQQTKYSHQQIKLLPTSN